jgi:hypothetical protein
MSLLRPLLLFCTDLFLPFPHLFLRNVTTRDTKLSAEKVPRSLRELFFPLLLLCFLSCFFVFLDFVKARWSRGNTLGGGNTCARRR